MLGGDDDGVDGGIGEQGLGIGSSLDEAELLAEVDAADATASGDRMQGGAGLFKGGDQDPAGVVAGTNEADDGSLFNPL